jgi:histidine ammonia-lyase
MDLAGFVSIVLGGAAFQPSPKDLSRASESFEYLSSYAEGKVIYGINTGFGPMAQVAIPEADRTALQYNLVRSHASGAGADLSDEAVRAMLLVRAITFLKGGSAVTKGVLDGLVDYLDKGICPRVPELGGVGASGDLVQQAHLGLGLIGEGSGTLQGKKGNMAAHLAATGLKPIELGLRDGLAILNGTACMTGIGLLNVHHAFVLLERSIQMGALLTEILGSWDDHLSAVLNGAKRHTGQREVAERMRNHLTGSGLVRDRSGHLYSGKEVHADGVFTEIVQEHYSIRCIPQILGPVLDTIRNAEKVLLDELHSVDDNPFTDPSSGVYHGGNFHGDQVALEMDKLRLAIVKLCMLCERQVNFLFNEKVNQRFPAFLNMERPGITLGMQGMQFTATSTTAENQALATSLYIHSISNNNDNQDIVSMGTNAANATARVLANTDRVLAIGALALAQAVDISGAEAKLSRDGKAFHGTIRAVSAPITSTSDPASCILAVEEAIFRPTPTWQK